MVLAKDWKPNNLDTIPLKFLFATLQHHSNYQMKWKTVAENCDSHVDLHIDRHISTEMPSLRKVSHVYTPIQDTVEYQDIYPFTIYSSFYHCRALLEITKKHKPSRRGEVKAPWIIAEVHGSTTKIHLRSHQMRPG